MKPQVPAGVLLALAFGLSTAHARDYDLDPDRWNGLGYLLTTAAEARVTLDTEPAIDLAALEPDDVLVILYPTRPLPVDDLLAFVDSGGYVVLADDHGAARPLLERLGIGRREAGPSSHLAYWDHQEGFALMRPAGKHFLFYNVDEVVANYPASLTISSPNPALVPVLSYDGGREHFAIEASLGRGKLLALADPSIFLNDMLRRFYGDKQFIANALRVYCQREPCAARLIGPDATWSGRFDAERARLGGLPKEIEARVDELDEVLAELSAEAAVPPVAVVIALLAGAALVLVMARVRGRERLGVGGLVPSVPSQISSPALDDARGLVAQRGEADFSHLALSLGEFALERARKADLEALVRRPDPEPPPIADPTRTTSAASPPAPTERDRLRAALLRVQTETASLRSQQPTVWSADRFLRLYDDVQVLLHSSARRGALPRIRGDREDARR